MVYRPPVISMYVHENLVSHWMFFYLNRRARADWGEDTSSGVLEL